MALTKTAQSVQASATSVVGTPTVSAWFTTNYGVSGVAIVTNGGTGPTIGCDFVIEVSNDGGTTPFEWTRQTAGVVAGATSRFPFALSIGGGADFDSYRTRFTGNTGQSVTVQADAKTTATI